MGWSNNEWSRIVGRNVAICSVVSDREIALHLDDGVVATLVLEGDCCSQSYFTDTKQFDEIVGATIRDVDERDEPSHEGLPTSEPSVDAISWHFLVFVTDKGHVTVDWRNDSNGYYDGWVNLRVTESEAR